MRFFDVTVESSNARDLVIHSGPAVSPPNDGETGPGSFICIPIRRTTSWLPVEDALYLVNLAWDVPFHIVRLESGGDILRIPLHLSLLHL